MKKTVCEVLDLVESIEDGDYASSVAEENWLADEYTPAMLVRMLEMAYQTGYAAAVRKVYLTCERLFEQSSNAKWQIQRFAPKDDQ